jgi:alpha-tubulin suppressor-like RCC1 family protein
VAVAGGRSFSLVSAGLAHTCAVTPGGRAFCWGYGGDGEIGDGLSTNRAIPTAVTGGLSFTRVSAGGAHSCGETPGKRAYCWGDNVYGELGVDLPVERELVPTAVAGNLLFAQVNASTIGDHTCGVTAGSAAYCWGNNYARQLGDGSTARPSRRPSGWEADERRPGGNALRSA